MSYLIFFLIIHFTLGVILLQDRVSFKLDMATSNYDSTSETTNLARIARIILGPCTDVLRAVLKKEMPPATLSQNLKTFLANLPRHKKPPLSKTQEHIVYGGNFSHFDTTLLYFLLRNICSIPEHRLKWGKKPSPTDRSLSANIERIRLIRNDYYGHVASFSLPDPDFINQWNDLFVIVKELESYIGSSTDHQDAVTRLKSCSMDPEVEQNFIDRLLVVEKLQETVENLERKNYISLYSGMFYNVPNVLLCSVNVL